MNESHAINSAIAEAEARARRERIKDMAIKALASVGFIALLAFGTWGTVQIIRSSPEIVAWLKAGAGNARNGNDATLKITLESFTVRHAEPFTFTWQDEDLGDKGTYVFAYECADRLSFTAPNTSEGETLIPCGEPYYFTSASPAISLTPLSPDNRFLDATVMLSYADDDDVIAEDSILLTVVNDTVGGSTVTPEAGTTTPPQTPTTPPVVTPSAPAVAPITYYRDVYTTVTVPRSSYSDPNGDVDLEVEILGVGTIERNNRDYDEKRDHTLDRDERGAVRFVVRNIGTKTSDDWTFEVELPTRPSLTYRPNRDQDGLAPGSSIEFILGFDQLSSRDEEEIVVTVDPRDRLDDERNRRNNTDEIDVEIDD